MDLLHKCFLVWAIVATLVAVGAVVVIVAQILVIDNGGAVFVTTPEAIDPVVRALESIGEEPQFVRKTGMANRRLFKGGRIINTTAPEARKKLGNPTAGFAVVANDPLGAARAFVAALAREGYAAEIHENLEPEAPPGSLVFVTSQAFNGGRWVIVFRRHVFRMGPRPPRYKRTQK